jgi:hypothetical protein
MSIEDIISIHQQIVIVGQRPQITPFPKVTQVMKVM